MNWIEKEWKRYHDMFKKIEAEDGRGAKYLAIAFFILGTTAFFYLIVWSSLRVLIEHFSERCRL